MFSLKDIKGAIEDEYIVDFEENKYLDMDNLHAKTIDGGEVDIHISQYETLDELNGKEFIAVDYQSNQKCQYGRGMPCDTIEEVLEFLNDYLEKNMQLRLF